MTEEVEGAGSAVAEETARAAEAGIAAERAVVEAAAAESDAEVVAEAVTMAREAAGAVRMID